MPTEALQKPLPLKLRRIRAMKELKGLSLRDVAERAHVPYATTSSILSGMKLHSEFLNRIHDAVYFAPMPRVLTSRRVHPNDLKSAAALPKAA